ncbi:MAG: CPBP family intramembrane glutamic endopeptidase [Acidobacteriaceae bacterium]
MPDIPEAESAAVTPEPLTWPLPYRSLDATEPASPEVFVEIAPPIPAAPPLPPLRPHIGHLFTFIGLFLPAIIGGYIVTLLGLWVMRPHEGLGGVIARIAGLAKNMLFALTMQGVIYAVLWVLTVIVFTLWWSGFGRGIHWNGAVAGRWFLLLAGIGVATGIVITLAGHFLPMPKAPPILDDITKSRTAAWFLMIFGITAAPLTEELAFRGFLLPSLVNIFRWFERKGSMSDAAVRNVGIPISIILTSVPFALIHAQQVSFSWGPVLLIGCVSVILCIVRLRTDSLACSIVVHSFYNLTLFTGLLIQTDGFRHLEKLKG